MLRITHNISAGTSGLIFAVKSNGILVFYRHQGFESGEASWARTTEQIVRSDRNSEDVDWSSHRHMAIGHDRGGSNTARVYAVEPDGSLVLYRVNTTSGIVARPIVLALGSARFGFGRSGRGQPASWHQYLHLTAGSDGSLYAIDTEGSLLHARVSAAGRQVRLAAEKPVVLALGSGSGSGWDAFTHVSAGDDGALYGVKADGSLVYYRHTGWATGAATFASTTETILASGQGSEDRSGWDSFVHVFAGAVGALYGVKADGSLVYYRHTGWATGAATFASTTETVVAAGRGPGSGWDQFDRLRQTGTIDGMPIPRRGTLDRIRHRDGVTTVETDLATVTTSKPEWIGRRILFQNMQLFPDTIDDALDPIFKAAVMALGGVSTAAVAGLVLPDPLVNGFLLASEEIKEIPSINNFLRAGLERKLYVGAGRKPQLDALIKVLQAGQDDVVALSEMWVPAEAKAVAEAAKHRYPHWSIGPYSRPDFLSSGLMVLSKKPITATDSVVFRASLGEDGLSSKGVMWLRIDDGYDLFVTHMQSDNPEVASIGFGPGSTAFDKQELQASAIRAFMDACRDPRLPAVLVGDFNLDAAGGRFVDWDEKKLEDQQRLRSLLRRQAELVRTALSEDHYFNRSRLAPFAAGRSPTDGLSFYRNNGRSLPTRSQGLSLEVWRKQLELDEGKQIDNFFLVPGLEQRLDTSPVVRVEHYADHAKPVGRRQMSDHLGVRLHLNRSQQVSTRLLRKPQTVQGRITAIQCFLETTPRGSADQIRARLKMASGGQSRSARTSECDHHRFRRRSHDNSPAVKLTNLDQSIAMEISLTEHDGVLRSNSAGSKVKTIPLHALLGSTDLPAKGATTTSRWWVGIIRGGGGEYAAEVELTATW